MDASLRRKVVAGTVAALAVGGAGAGIAATQLGDSPSAESKAIVNDAAKQLGIQPSELSGAIKKALSDRVDAAVAAGRLTKEEGAELKKQIASEVPALRPAGVRPALWHAAPVLPRARRGRRLSRPDRGAAAHPAERRQDPRRDRQGRGQVGRRPQGGSQEGREGAAGRGRQGRPADEGRGDAGAEGPRQPHRRPRQRAAAAAVPRTSRLRLRRPRSPRVRRRAPRLVPRSGRLNEQGTSRIQEARRRAAGAKRAAAALAAAGFLAALLLARASHPGVASSSTGSGSSSRPNVSSSEESDDFGLGSGSISPSSGSTPQAQTNVS